MKKQIKLNTARFALWPAARGGFLFVFNNWEYLLKISIPAILLQAVTSYCLQMVVTDTTPMQSFLWGLPASILFAWVTFATVRLMIFGERLDQASSKPKDMAHWRGCLQLSVILSLLFSVAMVLISAAMDGIGFDFKDPNGFKSFLLVTLILFMFWGLRFAVFPVVAAAGYPLKPFFKQIAGFDFSFRLIIMSLFCFVPVAFIFQLVLMAFIKDAAALTDIERIFIIIVGAPFSLFILLILNAACVTALKEILGKK